MTGFTAGNGNTPRSARHRFEATCGAIGGDASNIRLILGSLGHRAVTNRNAVARNFSVPIATTMRHDASRH